MCSVETYDFDISGGLMPEIQSLIAPPVLEDPGSKKMKGKDRQYRRAVNHDSCDSCKEGGDLLCCDRCPAAFHLTCHDPPLSDDDLPPGEWLCHHCKTSLEDEEIEIESMEIDAVNPLNVLISAAATKNPSQYTLPSELSCNIHIPGTCRKTKGKHNSKHKKSSHEVDSGIVHLPAKLCFNCKKSCRGAPLMQCDFCSLVFHFDCVDPPLTNQPAMKWMCPNHAEHLIDQKLLNSVSLSERVKLYDKFCGPISQDAIKLQFLNKIGRHNPPFRRKVKLPSRVCICVPGSVVQQSHRPPCLLPSLKTTLNPESVFQSVAASTCSSYEQTEWLSQVVSFQSMVAKYMEDQSKQESTSSEETKTDKLDTNHIEQKVNCEKSFKDCGRGNIKSQPLSSTKYSFNTNLNSNRGFQSKPAFHNRLHLADLNSNGTSSQSHMNVFNSLPSSIDLTNISELKQLDEKLIHMLAFQRLQQLIPQNTSEQDSNKEAASMELRARAVLCPLDQKDRPVPMPYRSLNLGLSADMDVYFPNFGHCNYLSTKHASIFYDEHAKQYELLNYSCYGTIVDGVLFATEGVERSRSPPPPHSLSAAVRKLAKNTSRMADVTMPSTVTTRPTLTSKEKLQQHTQPCKCKASSSEIIEDNGWEGAAILHHGSFIQCGCLQFVFSITEYGVRAEPHKTEVPT